MHQLLKILLVNKFYYPRGGDCIYTIELEKLLKEKGHDVAIFAMDHPDTIDTPYRKNFPSEVNFSSKSINAILRPFGTNDVKRKFASLLDDFRPDIVHLGNIHSQLSPVVAKIAHEKGIKVIWTLHDYKIICPRYDCLKNGETICEDCLKDKKSVVKYTCLKNSKAASILAYLEALKWNGSTLEKYTDKFVCPSEFVRNMMLKAGFKSEKLVTMHHFMNWEQEIFEKKEEHIQSDYYCYLGRISHEKGVETLLKVASQHPYKLKVVGTGPLLERLKSEYRSENIEFLGQKNREEVKSILKNALFLVTPSEWYEVFGLNNMEALSVGTPVLGANIGGIPELIRNNKNGILFESKNEKDLIQKIEYAWNSFKSIDRTMIAEDAKKAFSADKYYLRLLKLYSET